MRTFLYLGIGLKIVSKLKYFIRQLRGQVIVNIMPQFTTKKRHFRPFYGTSLAIPEQDRKSKVCFDRPENKATGSVKWK